MKVSFSTSAMAMLTVLAVAGCPKETEETAPVSPPSSTTTPSAAASTPLVPATASAAASSGNKPPIEARAKAELDNKDPTNTAGNTLAVEGSKGSFVTPTAWTTTKSGVWHVSASSDQKSKFASGSFGTEDANSKLGPIADALGYTECEWGSPESIAMGKDKLPASVADGVCLRAGAPVRTAYAILAGEGLNILSVGGWDTGGGNAAEVFEVFRNVKKTAGTGDASGIAACCAALSQNAQNAPPEQKGAYLAAAGACNALRNNPQGRAALAQVRAALAGANVPASCK
ncbi:MAG TPA: hypothetical protein VFB62_26640 [Polyangiaceae bacterium]|nr:hypothetical protein [Polyangiaceae bacterium]